MSTHYLYNRKTEEIKCMTLTATEFFNLTYEIRGDTDHIIYWYMESWMHWHPDTMVIDVLERNVPKAVRALHLIGG